MDFTTMTLVELREVARSKGLKSVSAMKKADLISKLQELSEETGRGDGCKRIGGSSIRAGIRWWATDGIRATRQEDVVH